MAKRDVAARYVGTIGGVLWAILQPTLTVAIYWLVVFGGVQGKGPRWNAVCAIFCQRPCAWLFFNEVFDLRV